MTTETEITPREKILAFAERHAISLDSEFVPWSRSHNAKEKSPSLNWIITLRRDGREILRTDYMAGAGHCPADKKKWADKHEKREAIRIECETGQAARAMVTMARPTARSGAEHAIKPLLPDVLYSLALDSDVLEYSAFDDWASNYGYDLDSRSAEKTWRACVEIALKLRAALGEKGLTELREACENY